MTQVFKTLTGKGLVEFTVVRNRLDKPAYFRVEYRLYTVVDEALLLREFTEAVTINLGCVVEHTEQDGPHGFLYLIPLVQDEPSSEVMRH